MSRVLVLHAHPSPTRSRVNAGMADTASRVDGVTVVDLYASYPRYDIDIDTEQERLLAHEVLVLQFPFHWYSAPSIVKLWLDLVLEYGFAYGKGGMLLEGKSLLVATSAGGAEEGYALAGANRFPIRTLLSPFEQTARLCGMRYLAPYVLFSSLRAATGAVLDEHLTLYRELLGALVDDRVDLEEATARELMCAGPLPVLPFGDASR